MPYYDDIDPDLDDVSSVQTEGPVGFDEDGGEGPTCAERVRSIPAVVGILIFLCISVNMVIGSALHGESCTDALADTRGQGDEAIQQCYDSAHLMVHSCMRETMPPAVSATIREFRTFVDIAVASISRMSTSYHIHAHMPKNSSDFSVLQAQGMWMEMKALQQVHQYTRTPMTVVGVGLYHGPYGITEVVVDGGRTMWVYQTIPGESGTLSSYAEDITGLPLTMVINDSHSGVVTQYPKRVKLRTEEMFILRVLRAYPKEFPPGTLRWGPLESMSGFLGFTLVGNFADPSGSYPSAEAVAYVDLSGIDELFMDHLSQSCEVLDFGGDCPPMRLFSTVRSSWIAEMKKRMGEPDWEVYDQRGLLTGASHGASVYAASGYDPFQGTEAEQPRPLRDVNASDLLIRTTAVYIRQNMSGYDQVTQEGKGGFLIAQLPLSLSMLMQDENGTVIDPVEDDIEIHRSSTAEFVVLVQNFTEPHGLDWYLVYASPTQPLLEKVARIQHAQEQEMQAARRAVEERTNNLRIVTYFVVLLLGFVCAVASVVVVQMLCMRPMMRIQGAMRHVASLDLDEGTAAVGSESVLSDIRRMQRDFIATVDNLREYRAYVPATLLGSARDDTQARDREAPRGDVAIVFTDIKGSTVLWKESAMGMNTALEIHNDVVRSFYEQYGGYEVKTIGDSFMVSFSNPLSAVQLAMSVQVALAQQQWPMSLTFPDAGLVMRIGINYGAVVTERNPVTGRVDYRGSVVNCAARVEAKALGGTTCITKEVYNAVLPKLPALGIQTRALEVCELKGLGDGFELYLCAPAVQVNRLDIDQSDCYRNVVRPVPRAAADMGGRRGHDGEVSDAGSACTSVHDATGMYRRTGLHLCRGSCTVAVCKLVVEHFYSDDLVFEQCNIMVRAVSEAASATDGKVGHVGGRSLSVFWNASNRCRMHVTAALRFAAQLEYQSAGILHVGMATGQMLHGNVGTQKQRFPTTIGPAIDTADVLADYTAVLGTFCLMSDCTMENRMVEASPMFSCLRLIDAWEEPRTFRRMSVYHVGVELLHDMLNKEIKYGDAAASTCELSGSGHDKSMSSPQFERQTGWVQQVLQDKDSEEGEAALHKLKELSDSNPDDAILRMTVLQLVECTPVRGCRGSLMRAPNIADPATRTRMLSLHARLGHPSPQQDMEAADFGKELQHIDLDAARAKAAWGSTVGRQDKCDNDERPMSRNPLTAPRDITGEDLV